MYKKIKDLIWPFDVLDLLGLFMFVLLVFFIGGLLIYFFGV